MKWTYFMSLSVSLVNYRSTISSRFSVLPVSLELYRILHAYSQLYAYCSPCSATFDPEVLTEHGEQCKIHFSYTYLYTCILDTAQRCQIWLIWHVKLPVGNPYDALVHSTDEKNNNARYRTWKIEWREVYRTVLVRLVYVPVFWCKSFIMSYYANNDWHPGQ